VAVEAPAIAPVVEAPAVVAPVAAADVPTHSRGGAHESDEGSLSSERAVLELARTSLTRGRSSAAIDALERHAHRFPRGRLAPERESMWVQALVSAGRYDSAREHAARFRRAYPGSMFQSVVDAALREIP
jgi:outer membrane protein assembly factor BamD (BamD/ComL family)